MADLSEHPFRETIHRAGETVGARVLQGSALAKLARELSGEPGVIAVRGCRSGAGVSFLVEAALAKAGVVPVQVDGAIDLGWGGLRQAAGGFRCAEKLVPALMGRLLATVVRGGLLPSTDPEMVAMQLERESERVLDFATGTPMTSWLLEREQTVGPALARRLQTLALPDSQAFLSSLLVWVRARSQGQQPAWMPPGNSEEERVRTLALAASACGLPLVWVFDGLDSLVFDGSALPVFWRRIATLIASGNRALVATNEEVWQESLEPCLPAAWRERLVRRCVRVDPLPPACVRRLLADRLATSSADLPGLPDWVVSTALPLGGTPREALVEAAMFWDLHRLQPVAPIMPIIAPADSSGSLSGGEPANTNSSIPWVEGLLAAAAPLPFIEAAPLARPDIPRSVVLRSPGLWVLVCSCTSSRCWEKIEEEARRLKPTAPASTALQIAQLALTEAEAAAAPPTWNRVWLEEDEKSALIELAAGKSLWESDAAEVLGGLWERLTRPAVVVA
ncbi:MAG: hypothetical protein ACKO2G_01315 [Verrucomicrobiales bacterium]